MTKQGRGMEAISAGVTVASVVGGIIGGICLILFAPALGKDQPDVLHTEYFLVACFGVLAVAAHWQENQAKGIFAALFTADCIEWTLSWCFKVYFWTALAGGRT